MAKGVQVRDEFDAQLGARFIELTDFRRRQRGGVMPGILVPGKGEGVLYIELELVCA